MDTAKNQPMAPIEVEEEPLPEAIQKISHTFWNFDEEQPLPTPRFQPTCPCCDTDRFMIRLWRPWNRHSEPNLNFRVKYPWRIHVSLKCLGCGWVADCDVPVTEEEAHRAAEFAGQPMNHLITWQKGQRLGVDR